MYIYIYIYICICIPRLDLLEGLGYVGEVILDAVTLVTYHQVRPWDTQCSLDLCGEIVCVFDVHVQWTTCSVDYMFSGLHVQWTTCSVDYMFSGLHVQWTTCSVSVDYMFSGLHVQWTMSVRFGPSQLS